MEGCGAVLSDQQHDTLDNITNSEGTYVNESVSESDLGGKSSLYASYASFNTLQM